MLLRSGGRPVFLADGIKVAKAGRKMPAVKKLHQESDDNTKPEFIFGHSCQAVAAVVRAAAGHFALPLACRIHEGVVFDAGDRRSQLDRMVGMILALGVSEPALLVADAYYAAAKVILPLLAAGWHMLGAVRMNAVAYRPPPAGGGGGARTAKRSGSATCSTRPARSRRPRARCTGRRASPSATASPTCSGGRSA